jgi:hypothetical protein
VKGYFLGGGMNAFMAVGIPLTVEYLLGLFNGRDVVAGTGSNQMVLQPPRGALYFALSLRG